jgi:dihydroorotate dehydrogenase (fumarate)
VRRATGIPLAVKLSPYVSSLANMAGQLVEAGANGLVLFNRFYQPDLDIEAMEVQPALELSSSVELRLPLRWIAILHRRHGCRWPPRPGSTPPPTCSRCCWPGRTWP